MSKTVTFTQQALVLGSLRASGSVLVVSDGLAQTLVDQGVATSVGLIQNTYTFTGGSQSFLAKSNNLSDVLSASTSRTNIGAIGEAPTDNYTYARRNNAWYQLTLVCDDAGSLISSNNTVNPTIHWDAPDVSQSGNFIYADEISVDTYTDGSCGTYNVQTSITNEQPNETYIIDVDNGCDSWYLSIKYYDTAHGGPTYGITNQGQNGGCGNPCESCSSAGEWQGRGDNTPWSNTVDANGTDWNISWQDDLYTDGCCGTYAVRSWYAFFDTSPVGLSSPDGGDSPNPPNGYVLTASDIYPSEPDGNTYATYSEDPMWLTPTFTIEENNQPWSSYELLADGSGGSYSNQLVQDTGTVMSNPFIWMFNGKYVRYYSTGTTYNGVYGSHPAFDIISCGAFGGNPTPYASGDDWIIEITLETLGIPYALRIGTIDKDEVDDGQCGRTVIDTSYNPEPVDTLLYDETISSYYYYSDGTGGYYATFYG